ncbi:kinase-like domain-containing protein [Cantharellus anzutake]|uniref:kinase-like domain-containing protein n=1 Tax=Cantharellus anzutake TaxID=1750568 RepID=UPI00190828E1|nr:kinase-like domain-containing protein [Cantharellus anzutake]KAF8335472.1 kinase-like domain-containing protein [Cantharellus anzutake]
MRFTLLGSLFFQHLREMKVWRTLRHPNIVGSIGYAIENRVYGVTAALVSQWCANGSVAKYLQRNTTANREMLVIFDVARGLLHLHSHNPPIIHENLKPRNILINDEGRAQLCDFGLSYVFDGFLMGQTYLIQGETLRFLAPESLGYPEECSRPTTESDVYAFGCTCMQVSGSGQRLGRLELSVAKILSDHLPYYWLRRDIEVLRAIEGKAAPWIWPY